MARRKSGRDIHGLILLDKRSGISSNQALQEIRRLLQANKAGHTGTLDLSATGLLPLCFGEATKLCNWLLDEQKRYWVEIRLGMTTDSGDTEGNILTRQHVPAFSEHELKTCLRRFTGNLMQVPPMYSALKQDGKRLYELARLGQTVERLARPVTLYALTLEHYSEDRLELTVHCSKGTYIRSLAEDIGKDLGCGGMVSRLRRLSVGAFNLEDAYSYEQLDAMEPAARLTCLMPVDRPLAALPAIAVSEENARFLRNGRSIPAEACMNGTVRIYRNEDFLGLGEILLDGKLKPKKLFNLNDGAHSEEQVSTGTGFS
jgi:tRNA pseudouridine55 synthase